jgi:predicted nicotinamide N-methyase
LGYLGSPPQLSRFHDTAINKHPSQTYISTNPRNSVLWKITPLFAEWVTNPSNPLWANALLSQTSTVVELGTGISALVALVLAPSVHHYIGTDQEYVRKLFRTNLEANASASVSSSNNSKAKAKSKGSKSSKSKPTSSPAKSIDNISFTTLDWETDQAASLKECMDPGDTHGQDGEEGDEDKGFDLLISCDCIYNEALVAPFVRTCAEICRLRPAYVAGSEEQISRRKPTVCIIAQQQRSPDVFETWLRETMREFRVWRLSDDVLGEGLKSGSGYLVHLLLAKDK